jgi:hypothetical protein
MPIMTLAILAKTVRQLDVLVRILVEQIEVVCSRVADKRPGRGEAA